MKRYFKYISSAILLYFTTAMTIHSQVIVTQGDGKTSADFSKAAMYRNHDAMENRSMEIVTFENRMQTINDTCMYTTDCIAVYNISYKKDGIKIKRSVIDSASRRHNMSHGIKGVTPDLTKSTINAMLATGVHSFKARLLPVTKTEREGLTELEINKIPENQTMQTRLFCISTDLKHATETLTYTSQDKELYMDELIKVSSETRMQTRGEGKNKEYNCNENIYENIYILKNDIIPYGCKKTAKDKGISLTSLRKYLENSNDMPDCIKKEIIDRLNE